MQSGTVETDILFSSDYVVKLAHTARFDFGGILCLEYLQCHQRRNFYSEGQRQSHNRENFRKFQQLQDQIIMSRRRIPAVRNSRYKYEIFRSFSVVRWKAMKKRDRPWRHSRKQSHTEFSNTGHKCRKLVRQDRAKKKQTHPAMEPKKSLVLTH